MIKDDDSTRITQEELFELFPDGLPPTLMVLLFEPSRLTIGEYRELARALAEYRKKRAKTVVVATTDKDQDGNNIERPIPAHHWDDHETGGGF